MKLQRLAPNLAFLVNQIITLGETPRWATKTQIAEAQKESERLTEEHFKVKSFDVYLAVTLRTLDDFIKAEGFALAFENLELTVAYPGGLGLPKNFAEDDSSNEKGDLERYFIELSRSLLMFDAEKFSVGKYFETAMAIFYQKPAILIFNDPREADILKTRHPIKTLGTVNQSFGFHVTKSFVEALGCLHAELGKHRNFGCNFRQQLNEVNTNRSRDRYCPLCKSLLERKSLWINTKEAQKRLETDFDEAIKE